MNSKYGTDEDKNVLVVMAADRYIHNLSTTFRYLETEYKISKSTLHTWFHHRLLTMDNDKLLNILINLYAKHDISDETFKMTPNELKQSVLNRIRYNLNMRATRGGQATKKHYEEMNK